jgi:serine/threonine protein kinase
MNLYLKYAKDKIKISDKPFAGGGEGNLHKILSPTNLQGFVAKLYHPLKLSAQRYKKLDFLYKNSPDLQAETEHPTFIWVHDILLNEQKEFVGFIMPFVKGEKLEVLTGPKLPKHLTKDWKRFDHKNEESFNLRLRLCFNLAVALYRLHSTENYVLVDLKPDNIIVQSNGLLSLVDMDSVEVVQNGLVRFPAPVSTPEYTPPESYRTARDHENDAIDASWDLFSMIVIFYRLLFGIHPFAASSKPPFDHLVSLHERIREGFFVHHPEKKILLSVIPPPHKAYNNLPAELKELFYKGLALGHENPNLRPIAEEWCLVLVNIFGDEMLKLHFQRMMQQRGTAAKRYRRPSAITVIPTGRLSEKDLLPAEYHLLLNWVIPSLSLSTNAEPPKVNAKINNQLSYLPTLFSFALCAVIALVAINIIPNLKKWVTDDIWLNSTWSITLLFQTLFIIPFFIMPYIYRVYIFPNFTVELKNWRKKLGWINTMKKRLIQDGKEFSIIQNKLMQILINDITTFKNEIDKKTKELRGAFNEWLKKQDLLFDSITEAEKNELLVIEAPFLAELVQNPEFEKYSHAESFNNLREMIKADIKSENEAMKLNIKNVQTLVISHEFRSEIEQQKNKIEAERNKFKLKINEDYNFLNLQKKEDKTSISSAYLKEGNIKKNYRKYLKSYAGNLKHIAEKIEKAGLSNITEIESINHIESVVFLNNGKSFALADMTSSGASSLATKLEVWLTNVSKLKLKAEDELIRIGKAYENRYNEIKKEESDAMKIFDDRIKDIENKIEALSIELGEQRINTKYEPAFMLLDKSDLVSKNSFLAISEKYNLAYKNLQEICRKESEKIEEEIAAFEKAQQEIILNKINLSNLEILKISGLSKIKSIEETYQQSVAEIIKFNNINKF